MSTAPVSEQSLVATPTTQPASNATLLQPTALQPSPWPLLHLHTYPTTLTPSSPASATSALRFLGKANVLRIKVVENYDDEFYNSNNVEQKRNVIHP